VVIALGGNDALRGLTPAQVQGNLEKMVQASQKAGAKVLLLGIDVPPNYQASAYTRWPRSTRCRCCRSCWRRGPAAGHDAGRWPAPDGCRRSRRCWTTSGRC
jgi:hypothetical protein